MFPSCGAGLKSNQESNWLLPVLVTILFYDKNSRQKQLIIESIWFGAYNFKELKSTMVE